MLYLPNLKNLQDQICVCICHNWNCCQELRSHQKDAARLWESRSILKIAGVVTKLETQQICTESKWNRLKSIQYLDVRIRFP